MDVQDVQYLQSAEGRPESLLTMMWTSSDDTVYYCELTEHLELDLSEYRRRPSGFRRGLESRNHCEESQQAEDAPNFMKSLNWFYDGPGSTVGKLICATVV
jgi:hypothetical protein